MFGRIENQKFEYRMAAVVWMAAELGNASDKTPSRLTT